MRSKSPELMSEIKKYIEDYYLQNRQSPSTTKIAEAVGIARGTAYKYLVEMDEKNILAYDKTSFRLITEVSASQTFFGWVFGFGGKVQILAPAEVKEQYRQMIQKEFEAINKEQE